MSCRCSDSVQCQARPIARRRQRLPPSTLTSLFSGPFSTSSKSSTILDIFSNRLPAPSNTQEEQRPNGPLTSLPSSDENPFHNAPPEQPEPPEHHGTHPCREPSLLEAPFRYVLSGVLNQHGRIVKLRSLPPNGSIRETPITSC